MDTFCQSSCFSGFQPWNSWWACLHLLSKEDFQLCFVLKLRLGPSAAISKLHTKYQGVQGHMQRQFLCSFPFPGNYQTLRSKCCIRKRADELSFWRQAEVYFRAARTKPITTVLFQSKNLSLLGQKRPSNLNSVYEHCGVVFPTSCPAHQSLKRTSCTLSSPVSVDYLPISPPFLFVCVPSRSGGGWEHKCCKGAQFQRRITPKTRLEAPQEE